MPSCLIGACKGFGGQNESVMLRKFWQNGILWSFQNPSGCISHDPSCTSTAPQLQCISINAYMLFLRSKNHQWIRLYIIGTLSVHDTNRKLKSTDKQTTHLKATGCYDSPRIPGGVDTLSVAMEIQRTVTLALRVWRHRVGTVRAVNSSVIMCPEQKAVKQQLEEAVWKLWVDYLAPSWRLIYPWVPKVLS